jgi:hypothetical protein
MAINRQSYNMLCSNANKIILRVMTLITFFLSPGVASKLVVAVYLWHLSFACWKLHKGSEKLNFSTSL